MSPWLSITSILGLLIMKGQTVLIQWNFEPVTIIIMFHSFAILAILLITNWRTMKTLIEKFEIYLCALICCSCFNKFPIPVKLMSFSCLCLYDNALRRYFSLQTLDKLKSFFHKCMKIFWLYTYIYSVTLMLQELSFAFSWWSHAQLQRIFS